MSVDAHSPDVASGTALCLSGGGFRAMLFHAGAVCRLNEAGLLVRLDCISGVSGGGVTTLFLGLCWERLEFEHGRARNLRELFIDPLYRLADKTIDVTAIARGLLNPRSTVGDHVARRFDRLLFAGATLRDLPEVPGITVGAMDLQTGAWYPFNKSQQVDEPGASVTAEIPVARVAAATCAYPPLLTPVRVNERTLIDGGSIDNLAIDPAWQRYDTLFVSDGLRAIPPDAAARFNPVTATLRSRHASEKELRRLRINRLLTALGSGERNGAYWGLDDAGASLEHPPGAANPDSVRTRLAHIDEPTRKVVIHWGYLAADAGLRRWFDARLPSAVSSSPIS
jgi:NTE family protein